MTMRQDKVKGFIKEEASKILMAEANKTSLITVTDCSISSDLKKATIFITVLPEDKEDFALDFTKRKRSLIREGLKKRSNLKYIPFLDVKIDKGEKARQKIDTLLKM